MKKITRYAPLKKPNEDGKPESPEINNQSVENHATSIEQGFQTTQFPPTFQNPIHPPVVQAYRHFDPFSYIEANGFPTNGDAVFNSQWQHWAHIPAPFMTSPYHQVPVNVKEVKPMMEESVDGNKSVSSHSSAMSVGSNHSEEKKFEKTTPPVKILDANKSFVNVVNDVVTIDPDFDLDSEFDLFHEMDHPTVLVQDFQPQFVSNISAPVEHVESKTRDFGVNTDFTLLDAPQEILEARHTAVTISNL